MPTVETRIPAFLRGVTALEILVVAFAAAILFVVPGEGRQLWAWVAPPFNSRFIGAVYLAALAPLVILGVGARWPSSRVVLAMILTFTTTILAVMLCYTGRFAWSRPVTIGFWIFYVAIPIDSAAFLALLRDRPLPAVPAPAPARRRLALLLGALLALYGVGLLAAPGVFAGFWPWPVDSFHGRIYAAAFLAPAAALWLDRDRLSAAELRPVAAFLGPLGAFALAGLLIADDDVPAAHRVDFAASGTVGFIALAAALCASSAAVTAIGRRP